MATQSKIDEGVAILKEAKAKIETATDKNETLAVLRDAGSRVGYKPAFRALVAGVEPNEAIRWKPN